MEVMWHCSVIDFKKTSQLRKQLHIYICTGSRIQLSHNVLQPQSLTGIYLVGTKADRSLICRIQRSPQSTSPCFPRLLLSLSLVAVKLWVGYKTWPPTGWHPTFVIGLNIGCDCLRCKVLWTCMTGGNFHNFFRGHWQSPCIALIVSKSLLEAVCKEIVNESKSVSKSFIVELCPGW